MTDGGAGAQLDTLITRLDAQIKAGKYKKALKLAEDALALSPGDEDVAKCRAGLLLELGRFEEAEAAYAAHPGLQASCAFERAYCLYRLGALEAALREVRRSAPDRTEARQQLEAQLHYRLGAYGEAIAQYRTLCQRAGAGAAGVEVQANVLAAYVSGGRGGEVPAVLEAMRASPADGLEVAFNSACALLQEAGAGGLGPGVLARARERLELAARAGEEAGAEEGLTPEDVAAELAPVHAQLAYVAQRSGAPVRAEQGYLAALEAAEGDAATAAAAAHNLAGLALRRADKRAAGEALRRMETHCLERVGGFLRLKEGVASRFTAQQRGELLSTAAATALAAGRLDVARELVRGLSASLTADDAAGAARLALLQPALAAVEGRGKEALAALGSGCAGADPVAVALLAAQLALTQPGVAGAEGAAAGALSALSALPAAHRFRPGVLATSLALLTHARAPDADAAALGMLEDARAFWSDASSASAASPAVRQRALRWVLGAAATRAVERGDLAVALECCVALETPKARADAMTAEPGLCRVAAWAAALEDPTRLPVSAVAAAEVLPRLGAAEEDRLAGQRLAATAAAAGAPATAPGDAGGEVTADTAKAEAETAAAERKRRSKKRKPRYPKGFDPEHPGPPPNPERWLPKWQRSDGKKLRRRRRDKDAFKGSQGAGKVDDNLDRTGTAIPVEATKQAPRQAPGKKKAKGRR